MTDLPFLEKRELFESKMKLKPFSGSGFNVVIIRKTSGEYVDGSIIHHEKLIRLMSWRFVADSKRGIKSPVR